MWWGASSTSGSTAGRSCAAEPSSLIPSLRRQFNRDWTPAAYQRFLALLAERSGVSTQFRHSETPCFFPAPLIDKMARYGREMVQQLLASETYRRDSQAAVPERYRVPHEAPVPLFVQADFGLDAHGEPKLVEIQGFPSLYAYQPVMASCYRDAYGLDPALHSLPGGLPLDDYYALLGRAIVAGHDPANVVLLEIDPDRQKTRCDFLVTERLFGVRTVDIRAVRKEGLRLFYDRDGRPTPIERIYNRAIVDELERRAVALPFDFRDDLDVEWAGHPNWFFRLSKFSLPYLCHKAAPAAIFLDRVDSIDHPERYVLKPLYSFAGLGVIVGPTAAADRRRPRRRAPVNTSCRNAWTSPRSSTHPPAPLKWRSASCISGSTKCDRSIPWCAWVAAPRWASITTRASSGWEPPRGSSHHDHSVPGQLRKGPRIPARMQTAGLDRGARHRRKHPPHCALPLRGHRRDLLPARQPPGVEPDAPAQRRQLPGAHPRLRPHLCRSTISMSNWPPCCASTCASPAWARPPSITFATSWPCACKPPKPASPCPISSTC